MPPALASRFFTTGPLGKSPCLKKNFFFKFMACGILVPGPGIEPVSPAVEALNHWDAMEVLDVTMNAFGSERNKTLYN